MPHIRGYTAGEQRRAVFDAALAEALKHYARPDRLTENALLDSLLVRAEADSEDADPLLHVAALRRIIARRVATLAEAPKTAIYQRVLDATYLRPAADQVSAARSLGLAYGTYRRHLTDARRLLAARLWTAELERSTSPPPQPLATRSSSLAPIKGEGEMSEIRRRN